VNEPTAPVAARVRRLAEEVGEIADSLGLKRWRLSIDDAVARLDVAAVECVLVGERHQGKTALFNELARRELHREGQPTNCYVSFQRGEPEGARIHTRFGDSHTIEVGHLAGYLADAQHETRAVEVRLADQQHDASVRVLDTPGLSGAAADDRRLVLACARRADLVLIVTDASSPLSASECRLLADATRHSPFVAVIVTKTDVHPHWREIRVETTSRIEQLSLPTRIPVMGVSSRLAARARSLMDQDPASGVALRGQAGIGAVVVAMEEVVEAHADARIDSLLVALVSACRRVPSAANDEIDRLDSANDEESAAIIRAEAERLRSTTSTLGMAVDVEIRRLTAKVASELDRELRSLEKEIIGRDPSADFDDLVAALDNGVQGLLADLSADLANQLAEVAQTILSPLQPSQAGQELPTLGAWEVQVVPARMSSSRESVGTKLVQNYSLVLFAGLPSTFANWLGTLGLAGAATLSGPLGVALGAGVAVGAFRVRRGQASGARARQRAAETVRATAQRVRNTVTQEMGVSIAEFRLRLIDAATDLINARRHELERQAETIRSSQLASEATVRARRSKLTELAARASEAEQEAVSILELHRVENSHG